MNRAALFEKKIIGWDKGVAGSDRTCLHASQPVAWAVGDLVTGWGLPNNSKYRTRITAVITATTAEIKTLVRPSRGFARHVRRQKQARRKR